MTRREIDSKFDDIVSFADISRFLDTPVKRYSSGMYVRLAFAVAAHLDPEILLVDEVLAVGDAQFQKRCLGRLGELAHSGRTVFLVSHNMAAISNLCTTAAHFENGQCQRIGDVNDIVSTYLSSSRSSLGTRADFNRLRPQWAQPLITQASILDVQGRAREVFPLGSDVVVEMSFDSSECTVGTLKDPVMGIVINHHSLGVVAGINTLMAGFHSNRGPRSAGTLRATLKRLPFLQGSYTIDLWLGDGQTNLDNVMGALSFEIEASDIYGSGTPPMGHLGAAFLEADWCFEART
jgi:lipopolysaccharide transport system ATP-binding protein